MWTFPSIYFFFLKIHLHSMALTPSGGSTKFQTRLSFMDSISDLMALCHFSESGSTIASAYVAGSSLSNNNILRATRSLADLRGCGVASYATGASTCSATLASLVESSLIVSSWTSSRYTFCPLFSLLRNSFSRKTLFRATNTLPSDRL